MRLNKRWRQSGKKIICVDFDGVIHGYQSGFKGMGCIPDPPVVQDQSVKDSIRWLRELIWSDKFIICIYSSRSKSLFGRKAMKEWLHKWGLCNNELKQVYFPILKPPAWLTIDDRAIKFTGVFPTIKEIEEFKPWNKQKL